MASAEDSAPGLLMSSMSQHWIHTLLLPFQLCLVFTSREAVFDTAESGRQINVQTGKSRPLRLMECTVATV